MPEHPEFPQPKARELSKGEADALVHAAFECERELKARIAQVHAGTWAVAEALYSFHGLQGWTLVGYETLEEFLAQPEIGMSRRSFFRLVQAWRDLHVVRQVPAPALSEVEPSKVYEVLPAVMRGDVSPQDALDDAKALGLRDLREKYRLANVRRHGQAPDDSTPLDASSEPARARCPTCQQWTTEDRLPKVIDGAARRRS